MKRDDLIGKQTNMTCWNFKSMFAPVSYSLNSISIVDNICIDFGKV